MRIEDKGLLREFALKRRCEYCGKTTPGVLADPHHLFARGMGGGGRLDIRINLISLCREDHNAVHAGHIMRTDLLALVAQREGTSQDEIRAEIARLRKAPK